MLEHFLPQPTNLTENIIVNPLAIIARSNKERAEDKIPPGIMNGAPAEMLKKAKEFRLRQEKLIPKVPNQKDKINNFQPRSNLPTLAENFPIGEEILNNEGINLLKQKQIIELQAKDLETSKSVTQVDLAAIRYKERLLGENIKTVENQPKRGIFSIRGQKIIINT
jgi:hypothetical protein